jgi:transcriptional regulator with XRE-family HTH domain
MVKTTPKLSPIAERRKALGINRETLAVRAGLSLSTIYLAERAGLVTDATAARLAPVLGCAPSDLLQRDGGRP